MGDGSRFQSVQLVEFITNGQVRNEMERIVVLCRLATLFEVVGITTGERVVHYESSDRVSGTRMRGRTRSDLLRVADSPSSRLGVQPCELHHEHWIVSLDFASQLTLRESLQVPQFLPYFDAFSLYV